MFVRCRWADWGAPWWSPGSFCFVGFIHVCPGVRKVHSESLGSFRCVLVVIGLIWGRCVRWGAPWVSSASFGVAGFDGLPTGVHSGWLGCALGFVGYITGR